MTRNQSVRIDKWLWCIRIFKSRSIAHGALEHRQIKKAGLPLKASYHPQVGELIEVRKNGFNLLIEVVEVISHRVGASHAAMCYHNLTSEEEMSKYKDWFVGKAKAEQRDKGLGRPTKKDRRAIDDYKEFTFDFWDEPEL